MKSSVQKESEPVDGTVSPAAVVGNMDTPTEKDDGINKNSNGKRLLDTNGSGEPTKKKARSFAVHVESVANVSAADAEGNAPKKLGESPALLKTHCKHEISLPPNYSDSYDFSAPITETLGGEAVSSGPAKKYKFNLDAFQRESVKCLERRESVLVAAHTSAGKTAVAEYAIAMSLRDNQRVIYTSPIKALSNQKFRELEAEFSDVGLMTGDVTINKNASCLVMTTEILRSMLYRGSEIVREVAWVIFDEVHYMRDKERGVVWEEAIILVPKNVRFVFLSATIPNAREFSEWIAHLKNQPCHTIYTDTRPVPLQHYMFPVGGEGLHLVVDDKGQFRSDAFEKVISELKGDEGGGGGGGKDFRRNRKVSKAQKAPGKTDIFKVVSMIKDRSMYPVIVFSFSRRDCETMAMQMSKLEFNDDTEKALVEKVYMNAIASLNDEDQDLPQIAGLLPILKRGVGIHHSGLLPIGKEIVEILFQEGLIKALFATETFAMGVNMPAKTVVFSAIRKFDGKQYRNILGGEYVQMSGRAGRRGQDEQGIAILICDEKLEAGAVKSLMSGTSEPLKSTFHLGYNMLLNLLRAEEADPEFVIARSLAQFQADRKIPLVEEKIEQLKKKRDGINVIPPKCTLSEKEIQDYFKLSTVLEKYKEKFRSVVHKPATILPFFQGGRIVRVHDRVAKYEYGWGAVMGWKRKNKAKGGGDQKLVVDVLLKCRIERVPEGEKPKPAKTVPVVALDGLEEENTNEEEWMIVSCSLKDIDGVSAVRVHKPETVESYSDRKAIGKSVGEVVRRFPEELPMLDPFTDLGIKDKAFAKAMKEKEALEEAIKESAVHKSSHNRSITRLWNRKEKVEQEIRGAKKELKVAQGLICREDLKKMKAVLRRLGFTTEDDIVEVKGRVACEVHSAHELVLTEFLLGGNMNEMTPEVLVAVLSCFVVDESKKDEDLKLEKDLEKALEILRTVAKRVGNVLNECNISTDMTEFLEAFNPIAMQVVYRWCHGDAFQDVCKLADIFEGSVVRCFRRLEELLRQLVAAAKSIGNSELEDKFEAGSSKLKRGIAFSSSLYT